MDSNRREVLFDQKSGQSDTSLDTLDEDDHLIEFQDIQEFEELPVLLSVLEFEIILLETMESEFSLIIDVDFHWLSRK